MVSYPFSFLSFPFFFLYLLDQKTKKINQEKLQVSVELRGTKELPQQL